MFKNYFLSVFRNLKRRKFYTSINVAGLSIGICSAVLIFMILSYEFSFDKYQPEYSNTYRVILKTNEYGKIEYTPAMSYPLPDFLKKNFPEFKYSSIIDANFGAMEVTVKNKSGSIDRYQEEEGVAYVGDDFFKMFKYDWIEGSEQNSFSKNNSIILSQSLARKYFGNENPIGKTLLVNNKYTVEVTGLVKDPSPNTEFPLQFIIPYDHFTPKRWNDNWTSLPASIQCMVTIAPGTNIRELLKKINIQTQKRMNEDGEEYSILLQPLSEVHFDDRYYSISHSTIVTKKLYALGIIGFLVLLISCINYINLNTALLSKNSIEIGIRKVLGGTRGQIFIRFLMETIVIAVLGFVFAAIYLELLIPKIETLTGFNFNISLIDPLQLIGFSLITLVFIVIFGGGYPALFMSKSNPINAIKSNINFSSKKSAFSLRKVLVVLQFGISQALIIATLIVLSQMNFLKTADMGFDKNSIVEISVPTRDSLKVETLKNELLSSSMVQNVSYSSTGTASNNRWTGTCQITLPDEIKKIDLMIKFIDSDFISTYGIKLLAGRNLRNYSSDNQFLVNQQFVKQLGMGKNYDKVLGISIKIWGSEGIIVGVVNDFNSTSLHDKIEPLVMTSARKRYNQAAVKLAPGSGKKEIEFIKSTWASIFPDNIFDYQYLDQYIESFYDDDAKILNFLYLFSGLAILLACLGLFGLVSFLTVNRTKEVGIRKVLGASVPSLLKLLSKDFLLLVLTSSLISWPVAYYFMNKWLEDFAYRIEIGMFVFIITTLLSLVIAFLTMVYQALKVANSNPVKALRYE
ncbi:MAG: ABC transporter permease [Ignavibacteriaceae bacterium]